MGIPCKKIDCRCSHNACDVGWVTVLFDEVRKKKEPSGEIVEEFYQKEGALPCPECLPGRSALFFKARNRDELQKLLQEGSNKPKESQEPRTRIL